jgi:hypothetical protein
MHDDVCKVLTSILVTIWYPPASRKMPMSQDAMIGIVVTYGDPGKNN